MSSTVADSGMFTVFEIAPEMNGCTAAIILMWPMCEIARSPTATSNTGRCSSLRPGAPTIVPVLVDVRLDLLDLGVGVAERLQRQRHRAVDDRHLPAADQLLELDEREVGLDAGRVAVHQERDRAGGRQHGRLRVAVAVRSPSSTASSHAALGGVQQLGVRDRARRSRTRRRGACASRALCGSRFSSYSSYGPIAPRDLGRRAVGPPGHQRGDRGRRRGGPRPSRTAGRSAIRSAPRFA